MFNWITIRPRCCARRNPLEDPLFRFDTLDSLLPHDAVLPDAATERLKALCGRIRRIYPDQLLGPVASGASRVPGLGGAIGRAAGVQRAVRQFLAGVADVAETMVVVAGTHAVDRAARNSGIYQRLGWEQSPAAGQAVCPVLHNGRLIGLQPKLNASQAETGLRRGTAWSPIDMPPPLTGPLGVLICLDFLYRESDQHRGPGHLRSLGDCRFLAVPSLTPHYTTDEFAGKAWEEARRYGRPVLYADIAGGTGG